MKDSQLFDDYMEQRLIHIHNDHERNFTIILGRTIGTGSFAKVFLGTKVLKSENNNTNSTLNYSNYHFAVKCVIKSQYQNQEEYSKSIASEISTLQRCENVSRVAKLYFTCETESFMYIGLELCPGSDLQYIMQHYGLTRLEAIDCLTQVAIVLCELHDLDIIYHDLKPENICFGTEGNLKLVDFGLACILDDSHFNTTTQRREVTTSAGTFEYSAPEVFLRIPHAFEADWWSFGVLAYELISGTLPFSMEGRTRVECCQNICSIAVDFDRNEWIKPNSVEESFISQFLNKDPKKRLGYDRLQVSQILNHEIFAPVIENE